MCAESPELRSMLILLLPIPGVATHELDRRAQLGDTRLLQTGMSWILRYAWLC